MILLLYGKSKPDVEILRMPFLLRIFIKRLITQQKNNKKTTKNS